MPPSGPSFYPSGPSGPIFQPSGPTGPTGPTNETIVSVSNDVITRVELQYKQDNKTYLRTIVYKNGVLTSDSKEQRATFLGWLIPKF